MYHKYRDSLFNIQYSYRGKKYHDVHVPRYTSVSLQAFSQLQNFWTDFLNAVYFRQGLACTLGLTNDLIDGGQPRAEPHLCKVKLNRIFKTIFPPLISHCLSSRWLTQENMLDIV